VEDGELELSPPHPKRSSRNAHKEKKTQVNLPARLRFAANKFGSPVVTVFGRGYSLEDSSVDSSHRLGGSLALEGNLPEFSWVFGACANPSWSFSKRRSEKIRNS